MLLVVYIGHLLHKNDPIFPTVAVVDLQRVNYQVTEGSSVVVCASVRTPNITCPVTFSFELNLSVGNGMMMKMLAFGIHS